MKNSKKMFSASLAACMALGTASLFPMTANAAAYKAKASEIIGQNVDALVLNRTFLSRNGWFLND